MGSKTCTTIVCPAGRQTDKLFTTSQDKRLLSDEDVAVKLDYWARNGYRMLASPSFLAGTGLFPGNALRDTSTRALKLYGSCMDSSERTFLLSCMAHA